LNPTESVTDGKTETKLGVVVNETVKVLLDAVQALLKDESERASSLNARASGLTGFIGVILSIAAAGGAALGRNSTNGLHHSVQIFVGVVVALALVALVAAVVAVVTKVLLPTEGFTIETDEVKSFPGMAFISQDAVMIRGYLMRGYVKTLERDRRRHADKATWLSRSYKLVCVGLLLVALAGAVGTLDRYVAGGHNSSGSEPKAKPVRISRP
jgi:nucleoside recognition membrane protein YjiH